MYNNELYHHGILGQKWGVRRYQNPDGTLTPEGIERYRDTGIIEKGTITKRVSTTREDQVYDNKRYVSLTSEDHAKWMEYIGEEYVKRNAATFTQTYEVTRDLRVMSSIKQGEEYAKMLTDKRFARQAMADARKIKDFMPADSPNTMSEIISQHVAMQTDTGKAFIKRVMEQNYDALVDTHGTNVSSDPVIILNPDTNLKRVANPEYTEPVQRFLEKQYKITG